jgi:multiple sugar transport system substrate-binding protein
MQRVVDRFNESQERLFVRYLVTGTIHQKAMIAIAGGNPPDIVGLYSYNVPGYAEANAILPLDDLATGRGMSLDQYASGMRQVMTYRGRWWGAVNTGGTLALYYNKSIFREAGLDPGQPPRTIGELDAAHRAITRSRADGALDRAGFLHMEPGWWSWIWGYFFGGSLYDAPSDRSLAASPENVAAYDWVQSYPRELGVDRVQNLRSGFGPYGTPQTAFLTGEVAMVVQGPWMANLITAFKPELDYGVAPVPVVESIDDPAAPITLIDTDMLMIPRGARDPEASMEFIAFTQRRENVESLAIAHCKGSPLADVSEEFLASHPNRGVRLHTALAASPRAFISPQTGVWPECKDVFDAAMNDMWTLRVPAGEALSRIQSRSQAMLDEAARLRARRGERSRSSGTGS